MNAVLVLNATYEPLNIVSVKRAIVLLLKDKAEIVEAAQQKIRAERIAIDMPLVIRLVVFVPVPRRLPLPLSRRTVLARDIFTCQYCGRRPIKQELTIDHVTPRSRGGTTTWENVVTACAPCNRRKGDRSPEEANMALLSKPTRPRFLAIVLLGEAKAHLAWRKYLSV
ncbi:MAG: HNH endonuclease [Chloroflexi bacterium]|nr:HNH endonuclease [Chloroflexota bacterium]MBI3740811.1 HNH endonuclease [Chloroflexota bacterium]